MDESLNCVLWWAVSTYAVICLHLAVLKTNNSNNHNKTERILSCHKYKTLFEIYQRKSGFDYQSTELNVNLFVNDAHLKSA